MKITNYPFWFSLDFLFALGHDLLKQDTLFTVHKSVATRFTNTNCRIISNVVNLNSIVINTEFDLKVIVLKAGPIALL